MPIVIDQLTIGSNVSPSADLLSFAFTTTQTVSSGAFIVVCGGWFGGATTIVTGLTGGGLTWSVDKQGAGGSSSGKAFIASAQAPTGIASGASIAVNLAGGGGGASSVTLGCFSFTGVKTSSPVDGIPLGPVQSSVTGRTTGSYSIVAGSVIVGCNWNAGVIAGNTPTAPSIEALDFRNAIDNYGAAAEYRIEAVGGSYPVAGTWNAAANNTTVAVAYLAASATQPQTMIARHAMGAGRW